MSAWGKKLYVNATEARAAQRVFEIRQSFPDMTLKNIAEFMKAEGTRAEKVLTLILCL